MILEMDQTCAPVCSVIIPSYRSAKTIERCLKALQKQDFPLPYEVIVVDSSPDNTAEVIRINFPQVQLIHLPKQTEPGLARNIGVANSTAEILAFIDADCVAAPDWLRRLYEVLQAGYDGVGGAIVNANANSLVSWAGYICEFREFLPEGAARVVDNLTLGNVAYRRSSFQALGGFPVNFFPQEDQVFHYLAQRRGLRFCLDPRITVAHSHRTEAKAFFRHQNKIGQANAQVLNLLDKSGAGLARHPWLALLVLPLLIMFRFVRTVKACWRLEQSLVLRQPLILWFCWWGMWAWGFGFVKGAAMAQLKPLGAIATAFSPE